MKHDELRERRIEAVKTQLLHRGYADGDGLHRKMLCSRKAAEIVAYAYQSAELERREIDAVVASCMSYIPGASVKKTEECLCWDCQRGGDDAS